MNFLKQLFCKHKWVLFSWEYQLYFDDPCNIQLYCICTKCSRHKYFYTGKVWEGKWSSYENLIRNYCESKGIVCGGSNSVH